MGVLDNVLIMYESFWYGYYYFGMSFDVFLGMGIGMGLGNILEYFGFMWWVLWVFMGYMRGFWTKIFGGFSGFW